MQKIAPFLWFDDNAEDAVNFYISIFPNSKIVSISRYGEDGPGQSGKVMVVNFELQGQQFMALNGGPEFKFSEAVSFVVNCGNQEEVDFYWAKLTADGEESQCGWLKDKYGLSWQIVPVRLGELLADPDPEKSSRVMRSMLQMVKIDLDALEKAYETRAA